MKLCIISGTNRRNSQTRRVADLVDRTYQSHGITPTMLDLIDLPQGLLSPDAYAKKPDSFSAFTDVVLASDGLHVVTPEYNGGIPGILKLFIDMLPFPESFENRPVAFTGLAAGRWGALRPVEQLQQIFGYRNAHIFNQRVFLPGIGDLLADDGTLAAGLTSELFHQQIRDFAQYCQKLSPNSLSEAPGDS